jgi:hypothetical protein
MKVVMNVVATVYLLYLHQSTRGILYLKSLLTFVLAGEILSVFYSDRLIDL